MPTPENIALPPKSSFGFFSAAPFFGADRKCRKKVIQQLLSRVPYEAEIESMWASPDFPPHAEMQAILECIRVYNGWPNALFLPTDSFLALAPHEGHYESFTADYDTVNDIFFVLHPEEKERMKASKKTGDLLSRSLVACGDIPVIDTERITPETTLADVLHLLAGSSFSENNHRNPPKEKSNPPKRKKRVFRLVLIGLGVLLFMIFLHSCPLGVGVRRNTLELPVRAVFFDSVRPALLEKHPGILIADTTCTCGKDFRFRIDIATSGAEDPFEVAADFDRLRKESEPLADEVFVLAFDERKAGRDIRIVLPGKFGYIATQRPAFYSEKLHDLLSSLFP